MTTKAEIIAETYPVGSKFTIDEVCALIYPGYYSHPSQKQVRDRGNARSVLARMQAQNAVLPIEERCGNGIYRGFEVMKPYVNPRYRPPVQKKVVRIEHIPTAAEIEREHLRIEVYRIIATAESPVTMRQIVRAIYGEDDSNSRTHHERVRRIIRAMLKDEKIQQSKSKLMVCSHGLQWVKTYAITEAEA